MIAVPGSKTESSKAEIPLLDALREELLAHRERQGRRGFDRLAPDALVFTTSTGLSPGRRNALRAVQHAAEVAGLVGEDQQPVGLHDLRHSAAAAFFALGLSPVEVARLLRHSNPKTTLTVYAGLAEGEVASRLGERLAAGGFGSA